MRCFASLFWKIGLPPAGWMLCMLIAIRKDTFNTNKFLNPYLASREDWVGWAAPWAQCDKVMTTGSALHVTQAQGSALHRHGARRWTITTLGAAQIMPQPKMKDFSEIGRCVGHRPWWCTGGGECPRRSHVHFHAMCALKIPKPYNSAAGEFHQPSAWNNCLFKHLNAHAPFKIMLKTGSKKTGSRALWDCLQQDKLRLQKTQYRKLLAVFHRTLDLQCGTTLSCLRHHGFPGVCSDNRICRFQAMPLPDCNPGWHPLNFR